MTRRASQTIAALPEVLLETAADIVSIVGLPIVLLLLAAIWARNRLKR